MPPPAGTPTVYMVPASLLTAATEINVAGEKTSGEVEYVILRDEGRLYVTVGSDHTDRGLESVDIQRSKAACPKVMAPEVWSYQDIEDHWDDLELMSRVRKEGSVQTYQDGKLAELMLPFDLMRTFHALEDGTVLFSGTVPLKFETTFSDRFEMVMTDPILDRWISHTYSVSVAGTSAAG